MVTGVLDLQCEPGLGGWLRYLPRVQPDSPCSPHGAARGPSFSPRPAGPGGARCPAFAAAVRLNGFATHGQRILAEGKLCEGLLVNKSLKQDGECRLGRKGLGPAAVEAYTRIKICFSLTKFTKHKR
jgi:hypothetical protein